MNKVIWAGIIFCCWIATYTILTKHEKVKRVVKVYLRQTFNDSNEILWTKIISIFYIFFPFLMLLIIDRKFLSFIFSKNYLVVLLLGVIGFMASLTLSTLLLDVGTLIKRISYEEMNDVKWMKQVDKVTPLVAVGAAMSEEFFQRLFIPIILYFETQSINVFLFSLIITSLIFTIFQLIYTDTKIQKFVKLTAGISLSFVSICLILSTFNVFPSIMMHGIYVIFFLKK